MKNNRKIFIIVLIFGLFAVLPAAAQKTEKEFQKMYTDFLKKKGYNPTVNEYGNISFGEGIWITNKYKTNGPQHFQMVVFVNPMGMSYQKLVQAANVVNGNVYGAKIIVDSDGTVMIAIETLLAKPKDFEKVFDLMLERLNDSAFDFAKILLAK